MNNNEEKIEEILGLDIKVRTNKNEEKIIRLTDFKNYEKLNSILSINVDYDVIGQMFYKIEFKHECLGYSREIL